MKRRTLLKAAATLGALGAVGTLGRFRWLSPSPHRKLGSVDDLARRFVDSLAPETRRQVCVDYDHPLRQYHNRGVRGGGLEITADSFTWEQREMLTDLFYAGLSEQGRGRLPKEFFIQYPGVHAMKVLICGHPSTPPYQLVLSGPHLNLRLGGKSREGVAFGGPQVYGDQRGNGQQGLPGNLYRYQFESGMRLFRSLDPAQQREAVLPAAPIQTQIELLGSKGSFLGTHVAGLSTASKALVRQVVGAILANYPPADAGYAWQCLLRNGGADAMFLSYYADGEVAGSGEYQIFRLEGPAAVFYFRGAPHVHAFVNVAMDGDAPLSVGEPLGENPAVLEGAGVKDLFERAMRRDAGADLAYYDVEAVVGRLRKGPIRAGDIYNLESWQDHVTVVEVKGSNLPGSMVETLRAEKAEVSSERLYKIASTGEVGRKIESRRRGGLLREATIAYLKERGFSELHHPHG